MDEQLLAFRGLCSFRVQIGNELAKYGIKLFMVCDVESKYLLNAVLYLGSKTKTPPGVLQGEYITREIMRPHYHTNRRVTTDNQYTSHSLAIALLEKHLKLVGILRKEPYVPAKMLDLTSRPLHSSVFVFDQQVTMVSCKVKTTKVVVLLSTEHHDASVNPLTPNGRH